MSSYSAIHQEAVRLKIALKPNAQVGSDLRLGMWLLQFTLHEWPNDPRLSKALSITLPKPLLNNNELHIRKIPGLSIVTCLEHLGGV